jgi:hypothetical protein
MSHDMTRAALGNMSKITHTGVYNPNNMKNPYQIQNPYGGIEDISWIL